MTTKNKAPKYLLLDLYEKKGERQKFIVTIVIYKCKRTQIMIFLLFINIKQFSINNFFLF